MLAGFSSESFTPDRLIAGEMPILTRKGVLAEGQSLTRGSLLGKITKGGASSAVKEGGNTGGGALTLDATTPVLTNAKVGVYEVRCTETAGGGGTFEVTDPEGLVLGTVEVGATFADGVKFTIADGTPDFIVGDGFDVTVAAGSGQYVLSLAAALDGSQVPDAILLQDTDATAAEKEAIVYTRGDFNSNAMTFGAGHTAASVLEDLRDKGIGIVAALPW